MYLCWRWTAQKEEGVRGAAEDGERGMPESDEWEDKHSDKCRGPTRGRDEQQNCRHTRPGLGGKHCQNKRKRTMIGQGRLPKFGWR